MATIEGMVDLYNGFLHHAATEVCIVLVIIIIIKLYYRLAVYTYAQANMTVVQITNTTIKTLHYRLLHNGIFRLIKSTNKFIYTIADY